MTADKMTLHQILEACVVSSEIHGKARLRFAGNPVFGKRSFMGMYGTVIERYEDGCMCEFDAERMIRAVKKRIREAEPVVKSVKAEWPGWKRSAGRRD